MAFTQIPFSEAVKDACLSIAPAIDLDVPPVRLHGGEESAAYRVGMHVVRIGPTWRTDAEIEWIHSIPTEISALVPEVIAPIRDHSGRTVNRAEGRPVSVWPFAEGTWADDSNSNHFRRAVDLLASIHDALATIPVRPKPPTSITPSSKVPELEDAELDSWFAEFVSRTSDDQQFLHGDFYAGNILVKDEKFAALIDWDDAYIGHPQQELAAAAAEWGRYLETFDLTEARQFVSDYETARESSTQLDELSLRQLIRLRLKHELEYKAAVTERDAVIDAEDRAYSHLQLKAFKDLARPGNR